MVRETPFSFRLVYLTVKAAVQEALAAPWSLNGKKDLSVRGHIRKARQACEYLSVSTMCVWLLPSDWPLAVVQQERGCGILVR